MHVYVCAYETRDRDRPGAGARLSFCPKRNRPAQDNMTRNGAIAYR